MGNFFDTRHIAIFLGIASTLSTAHASLVDEIEVFDDKSITPVGENEFTLHFNATPRGIKSPKFTNEIVSAGGLRSMIEISRGISKTLEIGLHIPTAFDSNGRFYAPGLRPRLRWIPVKPQHDQAEGLFLGVNAELSWIDKRFEEASRQFELRAISGYRAKEWLIATNPGWRMPLTRVNGVLQASFGINNKFAYKVNEGLDFGVETYFDFGAWKKPLPVSEQNRIVFLVADVKSKIGELSWGIGKGMTPASDPLTLKFVITLHNE